MRQIGECRHRRGRTGEGEGSLPPQTRLWYGRGDDCLEKISPYERPWWERGIREKATSGNFRLR